MTDWLNNTDINNVVSTRMNHTNFLCKLRQAGQIVSPISIPIFFVKSIDNTDTNTFAKSFGDTFADTSCGYNLLVTSFLDFLLVKNNSITYYGNGHYLAALQTATRISSGGWWNIRCLPHIILRISSSSVVWPWPSRNIGNLVSIFLAKKVSVIPYRYLFQMYRR